MNRVSALNRALGEFFKTTTLHGFKYLWSEGCIDRIGWLVVCVASTCCAGMLCAVLWARFLEVPALLELQNVPVYDKVTSNMPHLLVCPPVHSAVQNLNISERRAKRLSRTISNVLDGKQISEEQLEILEKLLSERNTTLLDMLLQSSPSCSELVVACRWQSVDVPCDALFVKELAVEGVCCVMRPIISYRNLDESVRPSSLYRGTRTMDHMDLALQCSNEINRGCKFYVKNYDEEYVEPMILTPGNRYTAQMLFNSVPVSSSEEIVESNCVEEKGYSRDACQAQCAEKHCGCLDPINENEKENYLPKCSFKEFNCLRNFEVKDNVTCACLPSCNIVTSDVSLSSTPIDLNMFAFDPIYIGLNAKSTVIHFQLNLRLSKIFSLNPTETWLTLLSSLGGVFNMFLGVGLFSALEVIYFILFKLPSIMLNV